MITNQIQTASISKSMLNDDEVENWHQSLSRVEPLSKFEHTEGSRDGATKESRDGANLTVFMKKDFPRSLSCKHRFR